MQWRKLPRKRWTVAAKRKSGGGRVVMRFKDIWKNIWRRYSSANSSEGDVDSFAIDADTYMEKANGLSTLKDIKFTSR